VDTVATVGCSTAATDATAKVVTVATITITGGWLTVTTDDCLATSPTGAVDCTTDAVDGIIGTGAVGTPVTADIAGRAGVGASIRSGVGAGGGAGVGAGTSTLAFTGTGTGAGAVVTVGAGDVGTGTAISPTELAATAAAAASKPHFLVFFSSYACIWFIPGEPDTSAEPTFSTKNSDFLHTADVPTPAATIPTAGPGKAQDMSSIPAAVTLSATSESDTPAERFPHQSTRAGAFRRSRFPTSRRQLHARRPPAKQLLFLVR
jgi:hypothetical protein